VKVYDIGLTYIVGGSPNQIRVEPDPERLALYGITLSQLVDKLTNANRSFLVGAFNQLDRNVPVVAGQTLQGGHILVRGSVGNRAGIQMREYKQAKPFFVVGETADDYLGEYMAGGIMAILNLSGSDRPVGKFTATGLVGGTIYIRGEVAPTQLGLPPSPEDILAYLRTSAIDGGLPKEVFDAVSKLRYPGERELAALLPAPLLARVRFLFFTSKYTKPLLREYRSLNPADLEALKGVLEKFFQTFNLPHSLLESVLASKFTVLRAGDQKVTTPIPPQEIPVEE